MVISRADTWWNKSISADNPAIARLINTLDRPLLISDYMDINPGELLSLSYLLSPRVHILLLSGSQAIAIPAGYSDVIAFNPSQALRAALAKDFEVTPVGEYWKLWAVREKIKGAVAHPAGLLRAPHPAGGSAVN